MIILYFPLPVKKCDHGARERALWLQILLALYTKNKSLIKKEMCPYHNILPCFNFPENFCLLKICLHSCSVWLCDALFHCTLRLQHVSSFKQWGSEVLGYLLLWLWCETSQGPALGCGRKACQQWSGSFSPSLVEGEKWLIWQDLGKICSLLVTFESLLWELKLKS